MPPTADAVQRLTGKLRLTTPLIAVYDSPAEGKLAPLIEAKGRACCFAFYPRWLKGETVVYRKGGGAFDAREGGCAGAQRAFGLERDYPGYMAHFLTDGVGAPTGEGLKATPALAQEFLDRAQPPRPGGSAILIGPLRLDAWAEVRSVTFFVDPDRLAALMTLAGFWSADNDLIAAPFSSGCALMWRALGEYDRDRPVIGCTDIAMRKYVPPEVLSLSVTPQRFEQMLGVPEGSFLDRDWWNGLLDARAQPRG
jgi:hypothetical protein